MRCWRGSQNEGLRQHFIVLNTMNEETNHTQKPDGIFGPGTTAQLQKLSALTGINHRALEVASESQLLVFGRHQRAVVYGITDVTKNLLEVRRIDGQRFKVKGRRPVESQIVNAYAAGWPIGLTEAAAYPTIALVEGLPDFLAAFQVCQLEGCLDRVAPVVMLSAKSPIYENALPLFSGKRVLTLAHADMTGAKAAVTWTKQLEPHATSVQVIDFADFSQPGIKNLYAMKDAHAANFKLNPEEWRLLPAPKTASAGEEWKYAN